MTKIKMYILAFLSSNNSEFKLLSGYLGYD